MFRVYGIWAGKAPIGMSEPGRTAEVARTKSLDDNRMVDLAEDGTVVGLEFLGASAEVDPAGVPEAEAVHRVIEAQHPPVKLAS